MKKTGKSNGGVKNNKNDGKSERKDKKSATGMNGSPKKGGHGGKYTWSGYGYGYGYAQTEIGYQDVIDVKDPNFEDTEETVNV